jgi:hypothetical protein
MRREVLVRCCHIEIRILGQYASPKGIGLPSGQAELTQATAVNMTKAPG